MTDSEILDYTLPWRDKEAAIQIHERKMEERYDKNVWDWISMAIYKSGGDGLAFEKFMYTIFNEDWTGAQLIEMLPILKRVIDPRTKTLVALYVGIEQDIQMMKRHPKLVRWSPGA